MTLIVNGEPSPIETPTTITQLLNALDAPQRGVAVAVDGQVIPRGAWPMHTLNEGDRVEVLVAVQGG